MARDIVDDTALTDRAQMIEALSSGCKPPDQFRIGTEHEKFGFYTDSLTPVPYKGDRGIRAVLEGLQQRNGWEPIHDEGNLIGLFDPHQGGAISLEPGGQFELSGAPVPTIHDTCREAFRHLADVREICEPMGIGFLGLGMSPKWSLAETPVMPKNRYQIMTRYMREVGTRGHDMMYRTATIQVNLDFSSEADMVQKMRVAVALQPIATALFANSPFTDGKPNGRLSERSHIWLDTDNNRAGMIPFVFDDDFGFDRWVDYALDVPMYFIKRGDTYHDVTGLSFRDLMAGKLPGFEGETATLSDWKNHLTTNFPEARLKSFIEMRGADGGPWRRICALPALWVGLLYDQQSLDAAARLVADWTSAERQALRDEVPATGLNTPFRDGTVYDLAQEAVALARAGLERRNIISSGGLDETQYLAPLEDVLAMKMTPAEEMLKKFHSTWNGSVDPAFTEYAF